MTWYSDPALNRGNGNHVYFFAASAGQAFAGSPAGTCTYVAFEDLMFPGSDFNYFDQTFVFRLVSSEPGTVAAASSVPEPSTWAMMVLGFATASWRIAARARLVPSHIVFRLRQRASYPSGPFGARDIRRPRVVRCSRERRATELGLRYPMAEWRRVRLYNKV